MGIRRHLKKAFCGDDPCTKTSAVMSSPGRGNGKCKVPEVGMLWCVPLKEVTVTGVWSVKGRREKTWSER